MSGSGSLAWIAVNSVVSVSVAAVLHIFRASPGCPAAPACPTCPTCPSLVGAAATPATPATASVDHTSGGQCFWAGLLLATVLFGLAFAYTARNDGIAMHPVGRPVLELRPVQKRAHVAPALMAGPSGYSTSAGRGTQGWGSDSE